MIEPHSRGELVPLSVADNPADALALKARYEKLPEVSRVVEVASLVPADQAHKLTQLHDIRQSLRGLPARGSTITPFPYQPGELQKGN